MKFVQALLFNSKKKHSVRYDAPKSDKDPKIRSLYINNSALGGKVPASIVVIVEAE